MPPRLRAARLLSNPALRPPARTCRRRYATAEVDAKDLSFGQPVYETHSHMLQPGEITPGITALEYAQRRASLAALLPLNSVAVLAASTTKYRSGPVFYRFHQDPNFFYLTGFNEPDALAVIDKRSSEPAFHLLVREKDGGSELWDGPRSGTQAAEDVFNADASGDIRNAKDLLPGLLKHARNVYTDLPTRDLPRGPLASLLHSTGTTPLQTLLSEATGGAKVQPLAPLLGRLRVVKSAGEVACMREAGRMSGRAFTAAMRQSWATERALHAFMDYSFKVNGCEEEAYEPVVASDKNALSIHYTRNDSAIGPDSLILVDAGGQYGGYVADVTRTWPNARRFSPAQRDLYEAVLAAQRTCVSLCRAGAGLSLDGLHAVAENALRGGLEALGFDLARGGLEALFPHHVGHYVGLDVHDAAGVGRGVPLRSGMCVTVEPGVYVPDDERWPAHFRGMGVRVEDSVCVTDDGPLNLTVEAVKEVADIEALGRVQSG